MEQSLKGAVSNAENLATRKYQKASTAVDKYVSNSPWKAVGIAAAIGALIGFFTAR